MRKELKDMNDKELDDFFRKKFGNPDIPYDKADWSKMKSKLDHHAATGRVNGSGPWYKGWYIPLVVIMVLTGIGLGWKYMDRESGENLIYPASTQPTVEMAPKEPEKRNLATMDSAGNKEGSKNNPQSGANGKTDALAVTSGKRNNSTPSSSKAVKRGVGASAWDSGEKYDRSSAYYKMAYPILDKLHEKIQGHKDQLAQNLELGEGFFPELSRVWNEMDLANGPASEDIRDAVINNDKGGKGKHQFSLALVIAPDVSALKIKDIEGLGTSVGFNLEYFFHPDISINAGALYAFKTYQGGQVDYQGYASPPNGISGNCWVLDIPLNLRYYVINRPLDRWYVGGGLSSYFMLREKYDLEYENYSGEVYTRKVEVENENRHYLGIANIGLGYQRVLSDRLAIQVEPYLKLPIKGIGEGEINLKSAGVLVGLKYSW